MSERRLVLVRHGVTDWNREGRFQGHRDPPLADDGREEARLLGTRLVGDPDARPARVITSTLARASETAHIMAGICAAPIREDARLIEIGQGAWEGRTHTELARDDPDRYRAWRRRSARPPESEPLDVAVSRLSAALDEILAGDAWPACVVSHGGAMRLLARRLLGLEEARAWAMDIDNASLTTCSSRDDGAWRLERWNDTRHLLGRLPTHVDEAEGEPLAL